jgi:two-component sensor histidine kinase/PAS domain-containing protein
VTPEDPIEGPASASWRSAPRYHPTDPAGRLVLDGLARRLAALDLLQTPIWVFDAERCQCLWANRAGLEVWRAEDAAALAARDIASTQSEAVYVLLNDYLRRVQEGERPGCWVTLQPAGTSRRSYQVHHPFVLDDGRVVLLIEAQTEPPAEELLAFAANHSVTIGLFDAEGRFLSGNPAFARIAAHGSIPDLAAVLPGEPVFRDWPTTLATRSALHFDATLDTERGRRVFRCELRRTSTQDRRTVALLSLFDVTDERLAEAERARNEAIEQALREKEALLQEIHHRVKNNLQAVAGLLLLQRDVVAPGPAQNALSAGAQRVAAMALVHQQLYGDERLDHIHLRAYVERLLTTLRDAYAPGVRAEVEGIDIELPIRLAVPTGLVLNELITTSFKYGVPNAPPSGTPPEVRIVLSADAEAVRVAVQDPGPGVSPPSGATSSRTLGFQLVRGLVRQLRGSLEFTRAPSSAVLRIPRSELDRQGP